MQLVTDGNAIAYSVDDLAFTLTTWSKLPPTKDDFIAAGGTVVSFDRVGANNTPTEYARDVLQTLVPSYNDTPRARQDIRKDAHVKLITPTWATRLYIVKHRISGEYVRVRTIAENRDDRKLYLFNNDGMPLCMLPTRKHITPKYISKFVINDKPYMIRVECVQLDSIRNAKTENRSKNRTYIPGLPIQPKSKDIRLGNKGQKRYVSDIDTLPLDKRYEHTDLKTDLSTDEILSLQTYLENHMQYDTKFKSYDEQIEFVINAIRTENSTNEHAKRHTAAHRKDDRPTVEEYTAKDGKTRKLRVVA